MIKQLRPFYTDEELAEMYPRPYDHTIWEEHKIRVQVTTHIARWLLEHIGGQTATDLSCGDGAILSGLQLPREMCTYGDFVHTDTLDVVGRIEETIGHVLSSDMLILSETLEHIQQPAALLHKARIAFRSLILSTPVGEMSNENPEHYWGWETGDMRALLMEAGFEPVSLTLLDPHILGGYTYQIWACT